MKINYLDLFFYVSCILIGIVEFYSYLKWLNKYDELKWGYLSENPGYLAYIIICFCCPVLELIQTIINH